LYSPRFGPPPAEGWHRQLKIRALLSREAEGLARRSPATPAAGVIVRRAGRCQFRQDIVRVLEDEKRRSSAQGSLVAGFTGESPFCCSRRFSPDRRARTLPPLPSPQHTLYP